MTQAPPQSTALVRVNPAAVPIAVQTFGQDRLDLLKEQIGRGWKQPPTDAELEVVALICQRVRLDVFAKPPQIYFIKRFDSKLNREVMTPQVSVDGLRMMASRSREYLGQTPYQWCGDDGVWKDIWLDDTPPRAARVGVYRRGMREPTYSVALWNEWAQWQDEWRNGQRTGSRVLAPFWASKPAHMLAKTAEGMSLKRAIPAETNELELAHLEELHRLEAPSRAAEYDRIFGSEQAGTAFSELPAAYQAPRERSDLEDQAPQRALNAAGQTVDTASGEVLDDSELDEGDDWRAEAERQTAQTPASPAPQPAALRAPVNPKMVTTIDDPLYQLYADRYHEAIGLELEADVIVLPESVVKVMQMGKQLTAKINAAKIAAAKAQRQEQTAETTDAIAGEQLL